MPTEAAVLRWRYIFRSPRRTRCCRKESEERRCGPSASDISSSRSWWRGSCTCVFHIGTSLFRIGCPPPLQHYKVELCAALLSLFGCKFSWPALLRARCSSVSKRNTSSSRPASKVCPLRLLQGALSQGGMGVHAPEGGLAAPNSSTQHETGVTLESQKTVVVAHTDCTRGCGIKRLCVFLFGIFSSDSSKSLFCNERWGVLTEMTSFSTSFCLG